jgi:hypothetical protein
MGGLFGAFVRVLVWVRQSLWFADEKIAEQRAKHAAAKQPETTAETIEARAEQQASEIGPRPRNPHDEAVWEEEWRGAAVLLAAWAEWDGVRRVATDGRDVP